FITSYSRFGCVPVEYVYESLPLMSLEFVTQPLAATTISFCHNIYDVAGDTENHDISVAPKFVVYIVDEPPMAVCTFDIAMLNEEVYIIDEPPMALILEKAKGWEEGEERMLGLHLLEFTEVPSEFQPWYTADTAGEKKELRQERLTQQRKERMKERGVDLKKINSVMLSTLAFISFELPPNGTIRTRIR
ncbi:hypothetical protein Tco_1386960, partial [Tanacetum coccineum]